MYVCVRVGVCLVVLHSGCRGWCRCQPSPWFARSSGPRLLRPCAFSCSSRRCFCSHRFIHSCVCTVVGCVPSAPCSASQSATSLPATRVCDRTWCRVTSRGRALCTARHLSRNRLIMSVFRCPLLGIHAPVAIFIAYKLSECISSRPVPHGRCSAHAMAVCKAVISPVLFV